MPIEACVPVTPDRVWLPFEDRYRSIGHQVYTTEVPLPEVPEEMVDACSHIVAYSTGLGPGDVVNLHDRSTPAIIAQEPFRKPFRAWLEPKGIPVRETTREPTTLGCLGSVFHEDGTSFPDNAFCVMWLGKSPDWELVFPYVNAPATKRYAL